jgi:hypothetical protein
VTSYTEAVQSGPAESVTSATGNDPAFVDPSWLPPSDPRSGSSKTIPAPLLYGSILLALVLLIVGIWAFGGFERRTDIFKTTPPGTLFTTGPYEFRFTEATAQRKKKFDDTVYWELVMVGEGRTTGNESIAPNYLGNSGMFVSKDEVSGEIALPEVHRLGETTSFDRHRFTPGLALIRYSVIFNFKDTYQPGPTIRFAVFDLVYGKHYLASKEEGWPNSTYARLFYLPVRVLPPQE